MENPNTIADEISKETEAIGIRNMIKGMTETGMLQMVTRQRNVGFVT